MSDDLSEWPKPGSLVPLYGDMDPHLAGPKHMPQPWKPPSPGEDDEIRLEDLWRVVRRQWWVILSCLVAVVAAAAVYLKYKAPVWEASTLIRVETTEMQLAVPFLSDMGDQSDLETEMLVAGTRPILSTVVQDLSLDFQVSDPTVISRHFLFSQIDFGRDTRPGTFEITRLGPDRYRIQSVASKGPTSSAKLNAGMPYSIDGGTFTLAPDSMILAASLTPPQRLRVTTTSFDTAVDNLQKDLTLSLPNQDANIFKISYDGTDRWLVRNVVNSVAAAFISRRREVQKTTARSTVSFLKEQSAQVKSELEAAEDALEHFRQGQHVVDLGSQAQAQVQRLADLQTQRTSLAAERDELSSILQKIQDTGGSAPDYTRLVAFPTFFQNPTFQNVVQSLVEAESSRVELRTRWTANYPGVVALDKQIALLKSQLGDIGQNYLQALNTQIAALDATLVRFGSDLKKIPARQLQQARLERQTTVLTDLYSSLQQSLGQWQVQAAVKDPSIRIVERAVLPDAPVSPKPRLVLALASVLGLMLGFGLAFMRSLMDKKLSSDDDVAQLLAVPVLSHVPHIPGASRKAPRSRALVTLHQGRSLPAEAYRQLRSSIFFTDMGGNGKREVVVTSPGGGAGKSVTSCNLAITFAQQGYKTLLIDADLRRSVLHLTFDVAQRPGLTEYLKGEASMSRLLKATAIPNLMMIPAGATPPDPSELLGSSRFEAILEQARVHFDAIVVDSPPLLVVTDAVVLASKLGGVLLVVRSGLTHRHAAEDALEQLRLTGARVLGVVVNDTDGGTRYGYRNSYYYKYYKEV